jgi:N-acetylmuramoyl-L-alanine amidase
LTLQPHQFFSPNKKYCPAWILKNWGWNGFLDRYAEYKKSTMVKQHWAEPFYRSLNEKGIIINERRFDDNITRGEVMALLDKIYRG